MEFDKEINETYEETRIPRCSSFQLTKWSLDDLNYNNSARNGIYSEPSSITSAYQLNCLQSKRRVAGFISKLYQSLQSPEINHQYVRWCKHDGKDMFIIENIQEFTMVILSRLFKHCKFASFIRQLNIYGFRRDTDARKSKNNTDRDSSRWYHPFFKPGRYDLLCFIKRKFGHASPRKNVIDEENLDITFSIDISKPLPEEIELRRRNTCHSLPFLTHDLSQSAFTGQLKSKPILNKPNIIGSSVQEYHNFNKSNVRTTEAEIQPQIFEVARIASSKKEFDYMVQRYEQMNFSFQEKLKTANDKIQQQTAYIEHLENVLKKISYTRLQRAGNIHIPINTIEYEHYTTSTSRSSTYSECTTDNSEYFNSGTTDNTNIKINTNTPNESSIENLFWD